MTEYLVVIIVVVSTFLFITRGVDFLFDKLTPFVVRTVRRLRGLL